MQDQRVQGDKPEEGKHLRTRESLQGTTPQLGLPGRLWVDPHRHPSPFSFPALTPLPRLSQGHLGFLRPMRSLACFQYSASAPFSVHSSFSRFLVFVFLSSQRRSAKEKCSASQEKCSTIKKNTYKQSGDAFFMTLICKVEVSDSFNRIRHVPMYFYRKLLGCRVSVWTEKRGK